MTVAELREQLANFPDDAVIFIETLNEVWRANYTDRDVLTPGETALIIGSEEIYEGEPDDEEDDPYDTATA